MIIHISDKNRPLVQRLAAWLEEMELPPQWALPMVQDFERGEALRLSKAVEAQMAVSSANHKAEHRGVEGVGQVMQQLAPQLRMEIHRRYGSGALDDRGLMRHIEKDYGFQFKPNYQRKARIMHPGIAA